MGISNFVWNPRQAGGGYIAVEPLFHCGVERRNIGPETRI